MSSLHERAKELFFAALDLPACDRRALLEGACEHDPVLKGEVESLLAFMKERSWTGRATKNIQDRPYATRSRSRSEYGSISTTIFLTTTLGVLRRPTVFIVMKPAASNFASVRVKFG